MHESRTLPDADALLAHHAFLVRLATGLLADRHGAEDVVGDAYVAALRRPPPDASNLRAWLAGVVRNLVRMRLRSTARRARREEATARTSDAPSTASVVARLETQRRVVDAVVELSEPYRTAIVLRYLDDLPTREVARRTGVPLKTAETRLRRGRRLLRARLDRDGGRAAWSAALLPLVERGGAATTGWSVVGILKGIALMESKRLVFALVLLIVVVGATVLSTGVAEPEAPDEPTDRVGVADDGDEPRRDDGDEAAGASAPLGDAADRRESETGARPSRSSLSGTVRNADGTPAAGARVRLMPRLTPIGADDEESIVVITDADGRFEFAGEAWGGGANPDYEVRAEAAGGVSRAVGLALSSGANVCSDLVLGPALTVRGVLVDSAETLVSGAEATMLVVSGEGPEARALMLVARSDDRGRVVFPPMPRREGWSFNLTVRHPRLVETSGRPDAAALLRDEPFVLVVPRGVTVRGRVVDGDARPIPGAVVQRDSWDEGVGVDADGVFELPGVAASGALIHVRAVRDGHLREVRIPAAEDGGVVDLGDVVIAVAGSIEGIVLDEAGRPAAGVDVSAHRPQVDDRVLSALTDENGRFRFAGLPPGSYRLVAQASRDGGDWSRAVRDGVAPGADEIELALSTGSTLLVVFRREGAPGEPFAAPHPRIEIGGAFTYSSAGTAERVRLALDPGVYPVVVAAKGHRPIDLGEIEIVPERDTRVEATLSPER